MIDFDYQYRRRYLDGEAGISITTGPALARRDDRLAWVFDYRLTGPVFTTPVSGRRGAGSSTIQRPSSIAARLWLWPGQPMRILQQFDWAGQTTLYRIDFATPPEREGNLIYQTDLYLDLFVAADQRNYAILDEDELAVAEQRGLLRPDEREQIEIQCGELVQLIDQDRFGSWLAETCSAPFDLPALTGARGWTHRGIARGEADGWPAGIR